MTVQTNAKPDARTRTDDLTREYIGSRGGPAAALRNASDEVAGSDKLLHLLEKSAQTLRHTAENVENRGLKLLLKVVAQDRVAMYNSLRQALGQVASDPLDPANKSSATSLQQGLQDIQTSMTVQQQGRENVSLTHLVEEEDALLAEYASALESNSAAPFRSELEAQQRRVASLRARLQSVVTGGEPIVARVFDTKIEGDRAVMLLRERGLNDSQIDAAPIAQLARPILRTTKVPASPKNTMAAGAFSGAIVGGIVGLALALFVWFAPHLIGWVTVGPWQLLIGSALFGAVLGVVFGFFIGQSQREDDLAVTADGLINGEVLVATYPQANQVDMVEDVLQVHHARELSR